MRFPANRVTPQLIEDQIASEHYFTAFEGVIGNRLAQVDKEKGGFVTDDDIPGPLALMTICVVTLKNGWVLLGKSACADPVNFDAAIGRSIAREDAVDQAWPLLGFVLREQLHLDQSWKEGGL